MLSSLFQIFNVIAIFFPSTSRSLWPNAKYPKDGSEARKDMREITFALYFTVSGASACTREIYIGVRFYIRIFMRVGASLHFQLT